MRKKTVIITVSILFAAILIAAALYFIPHTTQIDKTLTVTKLDASDSEQVSFDIHITGKHLNYLFQEDRMLLEIDPFDNIEDIKTVTSSSTNEKDTTGIITHFGQDHGKDYRLLLLEGFNRTNGLMHVSMKLCLLGDFDSFEELSIHCYGTDAVSLEHTAWSYVTFDSNT